MATLLSATSRSRAGEEAPVEGPEAAQTSDEASVKEPESSDELPAKLVTEGESAARVGVSLGYGIVSQTDRDGTGAALSVNHPLWMGVRHKVVQLVVDSRLTAAGLGPGTRIVQLALTPSLGMNMYWGSRVGVEARGGRVPARLWWSEHGGGDLGVRLLGRLRGATVRR